MATLYATFPNSDLANQAAGALLDHGAQAEDISILARGETRPEPFATPDEGSSLGIRGRVAGFDDTAKDTIQNLGQSYGLPDTSLSARGPASASMRMVHLSTGDLSDPGSYHSEATYTDAGIDRSDIDQNNTDVTDAEAGITTTTVQDAEAGAIKGTLAGAGLGAAAALAAMFVPGVGLVWGAGALASALGLTALGAGAGAAAGGVIGYLKDQGVPAEHAARFDQHIQGGGALLAIRLPAGDLDEADARNLLAKYEAQDINIQ